MQVPLLSEEKSQPPVDAPRLVMWAFRVVGFVNVLACLLVDVANITSVIKFASLNCPSQKCGYGPISSPILEVTSDLVSVLLSLWVVWFILSRYSIKAVKPGLPVLRTIHNRVGKTGWWVGASIVIVVYMNWFVFHDSTSDASIEEWVKAVEFAAKSLAAVFVGIFVWLLHNISVTHCLHYEGKVMFAVSSCLFLPQLSNVIFYVVVGVIQANHADPSVAASWIFFFMLASLASLMFTYLLKPSRIDEWRATLRMMAQVSVMSDYTPNFQKRISALALPSPMQPRPTTTTTTNISSLASSSIAAHSLPTQSDQRRRSLPDHRDNRRGSIEDRVVLDIHGDVIVDPLQAARTAAEEAVHKTEALEHDLRMLKASTVFSRPSDHEEKDKAVVDQMRRELARVDEGIQAQARKLARLEAQLKESEERQLQAIKTAQTEAQTNVLEMTEQLEKLEAFVVSTSKMVSEAIKPKDTSWWSN